MERKTQMQEFYRDKVVLLTGGTGSVGKLLAEKLLRACPDMKALYILVREKQGCSAQERVSTLLDSQMFQLLAEKMPTFRNKVTAVRGDLAEAGLGLSKADREAILDKVNIVFHCAATLRFNEKLKTAVTINMIGTENVCKLAQNIDKLEALIHVSTAYTNCHYSHIEEKVYPSSKSPEEIISLMNETPEDCLTPVLLDSRPNTYLFTKCMSEVIVNKYAATLPVAILRPAIVTASIAEPHPGWVDSLQGTTGIIVAVYTGLLRTWYMDYNATANIVPADMTVNAVIALAYCVGTKQQSVLAPYQNIIDKSTMTTPVVNYVMPRSNKLTWFLFAKHIEKYIDVYPLNTFYWYPSAFIPTNLVMAKVQEFFLHSVPALILNIIGGSMLQRLAQALQRIRKLSQQLRYFVLRDWHFEERNMRALWDVLEDEDKRLFPFNLETVDWSYYFSVYIQGIRKYLIRDDPSTMPEARRKLARWYYVHQLTKVLLACSIVYCCLRI